MGQQMCGAHEDPQSEFDDCDSFTEQEINEHCESILLVTDDQEVHDHKVGVKDFKILKVIGRGSFGKVMLVKMIDSGQIYAMKSLRKKNLQKRKFILQTKAEKGILSQLCNPFVIRLHYAFQTRQKLYLVMEFVNGGELFFHLKRAKHFSEDLTRFYAAELIVALQYLHDQRIIYRDLKPENILLDSLGHIKLTDFGLAKILNTEKTYTFCGTPEYMAPELLKGEGYSQSADWWTLGSILFEMMVGRPPFYTKDKKKLFQNIVENDLQIPPFINPDAARLVGRLLAKNPRLRLGYHGAKEIQQEPFFSEIDWEQVKKRQMKPPWAPKVNGPLDLSYIDPTFIAETVRDTPMTKITLPNESAFQDYSYNADEVAHKQ